MTDLSPLPVLPPDSAASDRPISDAPVATARPKGAGPTGADATGWMPLTAGQMDFWEEFRFHPDQPVSTVAHCLELEGPLDSAALAAAITRTVAEADTLALRFCETADGRVLQRVDPACRPKLTQIDMRHDADPDATAQALMRADLNAPLDLRHQPLSAQMLLRVGARRWLWYCRGHHIILDGFGMALIERRVARLYAQALGQGGGGAAFGRLAGFLHEETAYAASPDCARDRAFWADALAPFRDRLPVLRKGAEDYGTPPLCAGFRAGPEVESALNAAAARLDTHWADALTLLSAVWLACHDPGRSGGGPVPVWLPYMSRMGSLSANIPAMVVNIMPLIVDPRQAQPLPALLAQLGAVLRRQRRHGRYRIEDLARDCGLGAGQRFHFTPLVNVMPFDPPRFAGLTVRRQVLAAGPGDGFNLSFTADARGAGLTASIEADPATQDRALFPRRVAGFQHWLRATVHDLAQGGDGAQAMARGAG